MEFHNVIKRGESFVSRPALRLHLDITGGGSAFVGGFSLESARTTEVFHYIFKQATSTRVVTLFVYNEEYQEIFNFTIGVCPPIQTITYGVVNISEIMINSPQFPFAIYGIIGSGVAAAQKVTSIYESSTAIDIPNGICCAFGNRIVIANKNVLYFSDPEAPRTFVATNQLGLEGNITALVPATDGLLIATTQSVLQMPIDALAQGQSVFAALSNLSTYQSFSYRNVAASNNVVMALGPTSIAPLIGKAEGFTPIDERIGNRVLSKKYSLQDLRYYQLFATDYGFCLSMPDFPGWYDINLGSQHASFVYPTSGDEDDYKLVGILQDRDGRSLYLTATYILELIGDQSDEVDDTLVYGVISDEIVNDKADQAPVLRHIFVQSDLVEELVDIASDSTKRTRTYNVPSAVQAVIGTDVWSEEALFAGRKNQLKRADFANRSKEHTIEIGVHKANRQLKIAELVYKGVANKRPE